MFVKKCELYRGRPATVVSGNFEISLSDTFECGQAFRYECLVSSDGYVEYLTVVGDKIIEIGQCNRNEVIIFSEDGETVDFWLSYLSLDTDYGKIREDIKSRTDSEWLSRAADEGRGIKILRQDPWETLFSFIISQNNNIPRIRKIIRAISAEYGENLAEKSGLKKCPKHDADFAPCPEKCAACGICYSFPRAADVASRPEGLLPSKPGFRYKYLFDAAQRVASGECDLEKIKNVKDYNHTLTELKKILGVGDKVASCTALFGFENLEAFPIDVWMKRAINVYFDGKLDPKALGPYAGIAQQYIFHYIRNLEKNS